MLEPIYRGNDYYVNGFIQEPSATTGEDEPATSLVLNVRLSLTQDDPTIPGSGDAIDASLNKGATHLTGNPGHYACVFAGADIDLHIAASVRHVYVIVETGVGKILCNDRVPVKRIRRAA